MVFLTPEEAWQKDLTRVAREVLPQPTPTTSATAATSGGSVTAATTAGSATAVTGGGSATLPIRGGSATAATSGGSAGAATSGGSAGAAAAGGSATAATTAGSAAAATTAGLATPPIPGGLGHPSHPWWLGHPSHPWWLGHCCHPWWLGALSTARPTSPTQPAVVVATLHNPGSVGEVRAGPPLPPAGGSATPPIPGRPCYCCHPLWLGALSTARPTHPLNRGSAPRCHVAQPRLGGRSAGRATAATHWWLGYPCHHSCHDS